MNLPKILVVDDILGRDETARSRFCAATGLIDASSSAFDGGASLAVAYFSSGQREVGDAVENDLPGVLRAVRSGWPDPDGQFWALIMLDLTFFSGRRNPRTGTPKGRPGDTAFGAAILQELVRLFPEPGRDRRSALPIVLFTATDQATAEDEVRKLGTRGYLSRRLDPLSLNVGLSRLLFREGLLEDGAVPIRKRDGRLERLPPVGLVGRTPRFLDALRKARLLSLSDRDSVICIRGETGTGKSPVARYLHQLFGVNGGGGTLVHVDLNGIPETLLDAELFGEAPGARTGTPKSGRAGLVATAADGTLFLDEIGNLDRSAAQKLLLLMNDGTYRRLGGREVLRAQCRFLVASNKALENSDAFPHDLLARFAIPHLELPPLRERPEDVRALFDWYLEQETSHLSARWPKRIAPEVYDWLVAQPWEANVRGVAGLARWIARTSADATRIDIEDVPSLYGIDGRRSSGKAAQPPTSASNQTATVVDDPQPQIPLVIARALGESAIRHRDPRTGRINLTAAVNAALGTSHSTTKCKDVLRALDRALGLKQFDDFAPFVPLASRVTRSPRGRPARHGASGEPPNRQSHAGPVDPNEEKQ